MRLLNIILGLLFAVVLSAQTAEFSVEKNESGAFLLVQGAQKTQFDTATVAQQARAKKTEIEIAQEELVLLEKIRSLREKIVYLKQEDEVLNSILTKSRTLK